MSLRTVTVAFSDAFVSTDMSRVHNLIEDLHREIDRAGLGHVPVPDVRITELRIAIQSHALGEVRTILRKLLASHHLTHDAVVSGA